MVPEHHGTCRLLALITAAVLNVVLLRMLNAMRRNRWGSLDHLRR